MAQTQPRVTAFPRRRHGTSFAASAAGARTSVAPPPARARAHVFRGEGGVAERLRATVPSRLGLPSVVVCEIEAGLAQVTCAVRLPAGWSRDELERGRIRAAVFTVPPSGP